MNRRCVRDICVPITHFFSLEIMVMYMRERVKTFIVLSELYILPLIGEEGCLEEGTIQCIFSIWKD